MPLCTYFVRVDQQWELVAQSAAVRDGGLFEFNLSFREVEELFLARGLDVSYETIRRWVTKFGPAIARGLGRRQPYPGNIWHLDEVVWRRHLRADPAVGYTVVCDICHSQSLNFFLLI